MAGSDTKATLVLNNDVATSPISVTPILYLSTGRRIALPQVTLGPSTVAVLSINDALTQAGLGLTQSLYGYAEVQYTWPWEGLCASIRDLDTAHSLIFVYTLEPLNEVVQGQFISNVAHLQDNILEGIWWKQESGVTGFVALANVLDSPAHASISVSDENAVSFKTHSITIQGHTTSLVSLNELEATNDPQGGIRITYDGPNNGLKINGGLEDRAAGYSAHLPLHFPPVTTAPHTVLSTAALGLMNGAADPMMSFPSGTIFTPYSVVRNIADQAVTLTPTLWWMEGAVPHSKEVSKITLLPHQTRNLNVPALLANAGLTNYAGSFNLVLDSDGESRALLEAAGSVDHTNTYVFEVNPEATMESVFKSLAYWSTGNGDDTMISLWNPADEPQDFIFTLYFSGGDGHYSIPIHLNGRQSHTFNVSEIIHTGTPDAEGNVILPSVHEGRAEIMGSRGENEHILLGLDEGIYNVQKATCGGGGCRTCGGITNSWMSPASFNMPVGSSTQLSCMVQYNTGTQYNFTSSSKWSSTNASMATVSNGLTAADDPGSGSIVANDGNAADYSQNCGPNSDTVCPQTTGLVCSAPGNVITVTVSPATINMSSGDTSDALDITVSPTSVASAEIPSYGIQSNPSSSSQATVSFSAPSSFSGNNDAWKIAVSGSNSPSGIFTSSACASTVCSSNSTVITIPPQVLIQVLYGEAHGQAAGGDSVSEPSIGSSIRNRFGSVSFQSPTTWQATITPSQYNGISTQITTGVQPELANAVSLFNGSTSDQVQGSPCFFTPTASGFSAIQAAYNSGTTTVPSVAADPNCFSSNRQLVWKTSIGNNVNVPGVPAFIFERAKSASTNPAVVKIP